jgi:hypothetical protein
VIDAGIDSEQRRDLQSNAIEPFAPIGKLLHGFGLQATGLARGLDDARAGSNLRSLNTRSHCFRGISFFCVQTLSGVQWLEFCGLGGRLLGCFLRWKVDLGTR